jgi:beta-lactamase superfamily II metal-dependent hydrolase
VTPSIYFALPHRVAAFVACAIAFVASAARGAEPTMSAHFIDVGQALSVLLEFPCGAILVDTGAQDNDNADKLIAYLGDFFNRRADLNQTLSSVIITHPHIDHTKGLKAVASKYTIKNYIDDGEDTGSGIANPNWLRQQVKSGALNTRIRAVRDSEITSLPHKHGLTDDAIDPLRCSDCDPQVVILSSAMDENPGWSSKDFENLNNHSVVTRVDFGQSSFLLSGDLEAPAINTMVRYYRNTEMLDVDLYQVGHRGAANGTTASLLEAGTPRVAIISCGEWDFGEGKPRGFNTYSYGHPRYAIIDLLSQYMTTFRSPAIRGGAFTAVRQPGWITVKKNIYSTSWDGNIVVTADLHGTMTTQIQKHKSEPPDQLAIPEPDVEDHHAHE